MIFEDSGEQLAPETMEILRNYCYFCMLAQRQAFCKNHGILWKSLNFMEFSDFHGFLRKYRIYWNSKQLAPSRNLYNTKQIQVFLVRGGTRRREITSIHGNVVNSTKYAGIWIILQNYTGNQYFCAFGEHWRPQAGNINIS